MSRLVVNPGSPDAWEIELKPGSNSLGRGQDNDIALEHESISSSHCEIVVSDGGAVLKDLGSTNGTFVGGQLVEQAPLSNGQVFQAGTVELRFLADAPPRPQATPVVRIVSPAATPIPRPPPLPSPPATTAATSAFCKSHPRTVARFHCPTCQHSFCELCVNTRQAGGVTGKFCRGCGTACFPLSVRATAKTPTRETFSGRIPDAFYYPFKRDGLVLLATGTIFLCILNSALFLCRFAFIFGLVAMLILTVYGTGYFTSFFRGIVTSSAGGEEAMPDWPDVTDFSGDILAPFLQLLGTILASFLPAIVVLWFVPNDSAFAGPALIASLSFGCAYFPMAFLAVSMLDSVVAANPAVVLPAIAKAPIKYLLTTLIFVAVMVVRWTGDTYLPRFLPIPFLPAILSSFFGLYLLTVLMRILGLLYRNNKQKFGWFNH